MYSFSQYLTESILLDVILSFYEYVIWIDIIWLGRILLGVIHSWTCYIQRWFKTYISAKQNITWGWRHHRLELNSLAWHGPLIIMLSMFWLHSTVILIYFAKSIFSSYLVIWGQAVSVWCHGFAKITYKFYAVGGSKTDSSNMIGW